MAILKDIIYYTVCWNNHWQQAIIQSIIDLNMKKRIKKESLFCKFSSSISCLSILKGIIRDNSFLSSWTDSVSREAVIVYVTIRMMIAHDLTVYIYRCNRKAFIFHDQVLPLSESCWLISNYFVNISHVISSCTCTLKCHRKHFKFHL